VTAVNEIEKRLPFSRFFNNSHFNNSRTPEVLLSGWKYNSADVKKEEENQRLCESVYVYAKSSVYVSIFMRIKNAEGEGMRKLKKKKEKYKTEIRRRRVQGWMSNEELCRKVHIIRSRTLKEDRRGRCTSGDDREGKRERETGAGASLAYRWRLVIMYRFVIIITRSCQATGDTRKVHRADASVFSARLISSALISFSNCNKHGSDNGDADVAFPAMFYPTILFILRLESFV